MVSVLLSSVSVSVRLSVGLCSFPRMHISGTARPNFSNFSVHVTYGRGSVLLCRRCDILWISGFVNDVMFVHNGREHVTRSNE